MGEKHKKNKKGKDNPTWLPFYRSYVLFCMYIFTLKMRKEERMQEADKKLQTKKGNTPEYR